MEDRWQKCWKATPEIHTLLKESRTLESAREKLILHLTAQDWSYRREVEEIKPWDYVILKRAVRGLKNIISPRNERISNNSSLFYLWKAAREGDSEVSEGFIDEFYNLFRAIEGRAKIYPPKFLKGNRLPNLEEATGTKAARLRSNYLDGMSFRLKEYLSRYPSGLKKNVIETRKLHRKKILDTLGGAEDDWWDYRWHFKNVFKDEEGLETIKSVIDLTEDEEKGIRLSLENGIPFGVTPYYLHLMNIKPTAYDFAVRKQVFPPSSYVREMSEHSDDRKVFDFMRETDTSPVDLVTRRYPRVAIIKPYDSCPQICVYCQRNWEITSPFMPGALASRERLDKALEWFEQHDQIMDVLITGGDPLVMNDKLIEYIIERFTAMPHILSIRIATRTPVSVPMRITLDLCEIFESHFELGKQMLCMVTHFQHPYEITPEAAKAIKRIKMHGMHVYNQQVFTFANSRRFETAKLRITLKQIGVDPYYTFNMKGKAEIEEYMVPIARLLQERKEEARLLPGIYRGDEPVFNVPFLGKNHLRAAQDHEVISILPNGRRMILFQPWERNLAKVKPYLYTDVPILEYLNRIEQRGEDPQDYRSIWYYY